MSIDNDLFDSILDDVYNCVGDAATYNGVAIECTAARATDAEKGAGAADADVIISVQISVITTVASPAISKADIFIFDGVSYNKIKILEKNEYEYLLGAYKVI